MSIYNKITKKIILPLSDIKTGWNISKNLKFLNESQWWSLDQLHDFQSQKLSALIKHVYENVPYYRLIMDERYLTPGDFKRVEDIKKLPILTKKDVQNNFPDLISDQNINLKKCLKRSSSGSTGVPIHYYLSNQAYGLNKAAYLRGWNWMGFNLGDKLVKISQNERSNLLKKTQDIMDRTYLFSQSYSTENLIQFIEVMKSYRPLFVRSYPDPLEFIAQEIIKNNIKLPKIKAINTTGNMLFDETRVLIESAFNTEVFDSYSCEGGANFFECPTHTGYHATMEYAITELLDEDEKEVGYGEIGHHYTTDLWNYATPLIRYDSGDLLERVKSKDKCECGRELLKIKKIIGRNNDIVITPSGNKLIAQSFTTYFKYIPEIIQFQVHQNSQEILIFKLMVNNKFRKEIENKILKDWSKRLIDMKIKINYVGKFELLTSGKRRFVFRKKGI